jgi:hypothetical protein
MRKGLRSGSGIREFIWSSTLRGKEKALLSIQHEFIADRNSYFFPVGELIPNAAVTTMKT